MHSRSRWRSRGERGWTITESLVAVVVLAMTGSYLATAFFQDVQFGHHAARYYVAASLAKNRIEEARAFELEDLPLLEETGVKIDRYGVRDPDGVFIRRTIVDTSRGTALTQVTATVSYPIPGQSELGEVAVTTLLADRNPGGCAE